MSWQSIETAPKDGTEILAFDGQCCWLANWVSHVAAWDIGQSDSCGESLYALDLTHWMPLPAPPNSEVSP